MRHSYHDPDHWASVDLMRNCDPDGYIVTRVEVARAFRGKGHASALFDRMLADADREQVVLLLDIRPDGTGLDATALDRFYGSRGFVPWGAEDGDVDMEHARIRHPKRSNDMTGTKWALWSLDERSGRWVEIDSGSKQDMEEGERRRKETAERLDMGGDYLALPQGVTPESREPVDLTARAAAQPDPLTEAMEALAKLSALVNTLRLIRSNDVLVMDLVSQADEVFKPFLAKDQGGL